MKKNGIKVLVVEDFHTYANTIGKLLEKNGYTVYLLMDFKGNFWAKAREFNADIALLDHDLRCSFTGRDIAEGLKLPAARSISITSVYFDTSSYCASGWSMKEWLCEGGFFKAKQRNEAKKSLVDTVKILRCETLKPRRSDDLRGNFI